MVGVLSLLLLPLIVLLGVGLRCAIQPQTRGAEVVAELGRGVLLGLSLSSLVLIVLLEFGVFRAEMLVLVISAIAALAWGVAIYQRSSNESARSSQCATSLEKVVLLGLALLVAVALHFRFPTFNYIVGGQDQGVYVNIAHHFVRDGKIPVEDQTAALLSGKERAEYLESNYRSLTEHRDTGELYGSFTPGLYIDDISEEQAVFAPQFYHLHPAWLSVSRLVFGEGNTTLILGLFGVGSVLILFGLTRTLTSSALAALSAAALLAVNPAHSYFSRFPVSEVTTGFFFLGALYSLIRYRQTGGAADRVTALCAFGAFFFSRVTGFVLLPFFLALVVFSALESPARRRQMQLFCLVIVLLFAWSFIHASEFCPQYTRTILTKTLHLPRKTIGYPITLSAILGAVFLVVMLAGSALRRPLRLLRVLLYRYRRPLVLALGACYLGFLGFKGYRLGFTDFYEGHRWFDRRWPMAQKGFQSLGHLNVTTLVLFLSPPLFLAFLFGAYRIFTRALTREPFFIISVLALMYLLSLTVVQVSTPYLYYFGRYQVSELLPIAIVVAVFGLFSFRGRVRFLSLPVVISAFLLAVPPARAQLEVNEGEGFYRAFARLRRIIPEGAFVFLDRANLSPEQLVMPLRLTNGYKTFLYNLPDDDPNELRAFARDLMEKGIPVFFLAHVTHEKVIPAGTHRGRLPIIYPLMVQSSPLKLPDRTIEVRNMITVWEYLGVDERGAVRR